MKSYFSFFSRCFLLVTLTLQVAGFASSVRLSNHVPDQAVNSATFVKKLEGTAEVPLTFTLPLRNQEVLEELLQRLYDPTDEQYYGKYLSSDEFVEHFSPTQEDYNKVIDYATQLGLTVTGIHPNRTLLNVMGPASAIENAFNLNLHQYLTSTGREFYAPNTDPEVPMAIASIINGIVGLDNYAVWHTYNRKKETYFWGVGGGYSPHDIVTAYELTGVSANGSGQVIALFELGGYQASDINQYTNYYGLPAAQLKNVLVDGGSGGGIDAEVTLDIELALALAPKSQIYVYEGPNSGQGVLDTYNRIATDNIAKQVSTSWGLGEDLSGAQQRQAENAIFSQMAAHGQTMYAAAGDSGAYDDGSGSLVVDDPASQPYVVGVGGTKLTVSSNSSYGGEVVWNNGSGRGAGGGGVSNAWPIPSWQKNVPTVYSKTQRNVPDVSLNADPNTGYAIYHGGQWAVYGGTSCAAPLWAAFTARVNQQKVSSQKPVLGFANPAFYAIGAGASYATTFHDITSGNNLFYSAGKGYDNATGWGSFNGANLFASLTNSSPQPPPTHSPVLNITLKPSTFFFVKGKTGTYTINVANQGQGSTSGTVTVTITLPTGFTCESLSGSGWTFNQQTLTCTQTHALSAGSSYSPITLKVNVGTNAPTLATTKAKVSGGDSASKTASSEVFVL